MESPAILKKLFHYIDENKETFINNLRESIAIASCLNGNDRIKQYEMVYWIAECMRLVGIKASLKDIGSQLLPNGVQVPLPPVIFGTLGQSSHKKTVCVYGHLDVPQIRSDRQWNYSSLVLKELDEKLYGDGISVNKGPVMCWLNVLEGFLDIGEEVPVNLKFIFEAMAEEHSVGLFDLLMEEREFLDDVDYVCITETTWLGSTKPCISYRLRGFCYFSLEVECAAQDLHSGSHGGSVHEAMADLIYLLNTLVDKEGRILITDFNKKVVFVDSEEKVMYSNLDFDIDAYRSFIGATKLPHDEDKLKILLHMWRYPSLSFHGVEGAFSSSGAKAVIPAKVTGKFSVTLVPNQTFDNVEQLINSYLAQKWKERGSSNNMKILRGSHGPTFTTDRFHPHIFAARKAIAAVYKQHPDFICNGASLPIAAILQDITKTNVVILPIANGDFTTRDESITIRSYIEGAKVLGAYLYEVSLLQTGVIVI